MAFPDLPWSDVFLIFSCFVKMHKHTSPYIPLNLPLPSQLSPYGSGLASCSRMKILNYVSCLQLRNRLTYECSDIFLCTHTPSNDLLMKKMGHLKIINIQRRLPNSDQQLRAPCNQRSSPNKRPPPKPKQPDKSGVGFSHETWKKSQNNENYKFFPAHQRKITEKCK